MPYLYRITLQGHSASDKTTLSFDIGEPVDHLAALNAANQIRGALVDVTKANVSKETLTDILSEDGTRPADSSADTFEEAVVLTYLNQALEAEKLWPGRIPAPIDALFLSDAQTLDTGNALLIQLVQQIAQHAFVSDGEQINDALDNGIKSGYKRSRPRKLKS
jgi:hypothetical protein